MSTVDYHAIRRASRQIEEKRVKINEVNMATRYLTATDINNGQIQIIMDLFPAVVDIPMPGDTWVIRKSGLDWRLMRRVENTLEQTKVESLVAGDKRLEAESTLYLNGSQVKVNGDVAIAIPDWTIVDTFFNGWVNSTASLFPPGFAPARYLLDPLGFVHLSGTITAGGNATTAFVLPEGYRPDFTLPFGDTVIVNILVNGKVRPSNGSVDVSLEGISFRAA